MKPLRGETLAAILPRLGERGGVRADQSLGYYFDFAEFRTMLALLTLTFTCFSFGCRKKAASGPDFSRTNVVAAVFDGTNTDSGHGLQHAPWERDGQSTPALVDGVPCRHLKLSEFDPGFFYFTIHPTFKKRSVKNVAIEVEFYDQGSGRIGLEYDGSKTSEQPNPAYTVLRQIESIGDSRLWRTASFRVRNATFRGAQNSGADFRLWVSPPELYVRRVTVTRAK